MTALYPEIEPYATLRIEVDAPHVLWVEQSGNPQGLPIVFLHGGPGSSCKPHHRRLFDPARFRIVTLDQRGCGRSTPHGELDGNTTPALIADLETVRARLGIERWVLFGGSWGATLALACAEAHPQRALGLVLRGTFLGTRREVDWLFHEGANRVFADHWQRFLEPLAPGEHGDPVAACHRRLFGADSAACAAAARAWMAWTAAVATYTLGAPAAAPGELAEADIRRVRIEAHYAVNDYFLRPGQLLEEADRLADLPVTIVHGRNDLMCPLESSWALHRRLTRSQLEVVAGAGHLVEEPALAAALVRATDALG